MKFAEFLEILLFVAAPVGVALGMWLSWGCPQAIRQVVILIGLFLFVGFLSWNLLSWGQ